MLRGGISLVALLVWVGPVRADLCGEALAVGRLPLPAVAHVSPADSDATSSDAAPDEPWLALVGSPDPLVYGRVESLLLARFAATCPAGARAAMGSPDRSASAVRQLPPAPAGDVLCLSGVLSLGALQVLRRTRFVQTPEWYHASSVRQVRHIFVCDFQPLTDFCAAVRLSAGVAAQAHCICRRSEQFDRTPYPASCALAVIGPRAPPASCLA